MSGRTVAIGARSLSKRFKIGTRRRHDSLRDALTAAATSPPRKVASLFRGDSSTVNGLDRNVWALQEVSFDIAQGEVVGIIGRNGAGKSTLLKILARITEPTSGYADVRGRVGALLEVGTGFNPELTGRENVYLNAAILGMSRREIQRKFDDIVSFAEVERFVDTPVKHYSSGMALRLGFAVAAHLEPEILIVDEVLAVGDLAFQQKCLGKMEQVSAEGRTVLFVSHNMAAITGLCSRGLWIDGGRLAMDAPATDVVGAYTAHALGVGTARDASRDLGGGNGFFVTSAHVEGEDGDPTSVLDVEEEARIRVDYRVEHPLSCRLVVIVRVEGAIAFASAQPHEVRYARPGQYTAAVTIPANLLTEGLHVIDLSAFASRGKKEHYCQLRDVAAFQTFDRVRGTSARGDYAEGLSGLVRPKLAWTEATMVDKHELSPQQ